mmetsp:Transcript_17035/g.57195  ORF Transcript_17035/g.57195 Transcript_17035/m.57195 type:complete len:343 (+) Transcript_17035:488-1516(+)
MLQRQLMRQASARLPRRMTQGALQGARSPVRAASGLGAHHAPAHRRVLPGPEPAGPGTRLAAGRARGGPEGRDQECGLRARSSNGAGALVAEGRVLPLPLDVGLALGRCGIVVILVLLEVVPRLLHKAPLHALESIHELSAAARLLVLGSEPPADDAEHLAGQHAPGGGLLLVELGEVRHGHAVPQRHAPEGVPGHDDIAFLHGLSVAIERDGRAGRGGSGGQRGLPGGGLGGDARGRGGPGGGDAWEARGGGGLRRAGREGRVRHGNDERRAGRHGPAEVRGGLLVGALGLGVLAEGRRAEHGRLVHRFDGHAGEVARHVLTRRPAAAKLRLAAAARPMGH